MYSFLKTNRKFNHIKFIIIFYIKQSVSFIQYLLFPLKCLKCQKIIPFTRKRLKTDTLDNDKAQLSTDIEESDNLFGEYFCSDCINIAFESFEPPFCEKCGKKFDYDEYEDSQKHFCEDCIKEPAIVGKVRAGVRYSGIVKKSIHSFKYKKNFGLKEPLGRILFEGFNEYFSVSDIDLIIPIPLHISKLKQRGFDQSFLVVKSLMKILEKKKGCIKLKEDHLSLKRIKKTDPQILFTAEQRKENVKNAFKVMNIKRIKNKKILLVDDVYTTGATSTEAAFELLNAGAASVDVLVIARV